MQFATSTELETHIGAEFTTTQHARADHILERASAVVASYCTAVALEQAEGTITIRGRYGSELPLPRGPVVSVSEVQVDGVVVTDYVLVKDALIRDAATTETTFRTGYSHWGGDGVEVQVTYTHGYATPPDEVKTVVLDMAARFWENPAGLRQETIAGDYSRTFAEMSSGVSGGVSLSEAEKLTLRRYRRTTEAMPV